jgi:hypothetical protein
MGFLALIPVEINNLKVVFIRCSDVNNNADIFSWGAPCKRL